MTRALRRLLACAAAVGLAAVGLAACDPIEGLDPAPIDDLDSARALWESRGPSSYEIEFRWICFCPPDFVEWVTLTVADGEIVAGARRDTGTPLTPEELAEYRSVEELFDFLEQAHAQGAAAVDATFDGTYGHPISAYVDYSEQAADEEMGFRAQELRPVR